MNLMCFHLSSVAQFHENKIQYFIQIIFWITFIKFSHYRCAHTHTCYNIFHLNLKCSAEWAFPRIVVQCKWHRSICESNYKLANFFFFIIFIFYSFHWNWWLTIQRDWIQNVPFNRKWKTKNMKFISTEWWPHCVRYLISGIGSNAVTMKHFIFFFRGKESLNHFATHAYHLTTQLKWVVNFMQNTICT